MEVKLLDSGLADIKNTLNKFARDVIIKKYKAKPEKCKLYVVVKRGDIEMKNGEWLKKPSMYSAGNDKTKVYLTQDDITRLFDKSNLNMGLLGYGNPKGGLKELAKWVKHNVSPKQIQGENRDLNMEIESVSPGRGGKSAQIVIRVPEKGLETSKDLGNTKLESLGYLGAKEWTKEQLGKIKDSDNKLDKVLIAILTGKAKLKDKVEDVLKNE